MVMDIAVALLTLAFLILGAFWRIKKDLEKANILAMINIFIVVVLRISDCEVASRMFIVPFGSWALVTISQEFLENFRGTLKSISLYAFWSIATVVVVLPFHKYYSLLLGIYFFVALLYVVFSHIVKRFNKNSQRNSA